MDNSRLFHDGRLRISVFLLNSAVLFGIHFTHDLPSPLQGVFQASPHCNNQSTIQSNTTCIPGLGFTPFQYNQLYAVYSISEAVTAVVAGYVVDRLGRTANLVSAGLLSGLGGIALALGPLLISTNYATLATMLAGRFLMAVSNALLFVLQGVIIIFWFEDRVTSAFGAISSSNAAGEVLNFMVTKHISNALALQWTLWIGAIIVIVGTSLPALILSYLDAKGTSENKRGSRQVRQSGVRFADLLDLPVQYWFLVFTRVFFNGMIWSLIGDVSKFVTDKYDYSESSAIPSYFAGIFFGLSTIGCFLAGTIMDYVGYRLVITSISIMGSMATLCLMAFTFFPPHVCAVFISIFYSFATVSVIACISDTVPESTVGTAIGITLALEMCFTAASNVVIGLILGNTHATSDVEMLRRWCWTIVYTIGLTGVALAFSLIANYRDYQTNGALNKNQSEIDKERHAKDGFAQLTQEDEEK